MNFYHCMCKGNSYQLSMERRDCSTELRKYHMNKLLGDRRMWGLMVRMNHHFRIERNLH